MPQQPHSRDMSMLVGTSKTLERAISGLQMNTRRLATLLAEETASPGIALLISALAALTKEDRDKVDDILSHRARGKRKPK